MIPNMKNFEPARSKCKQSGAALVIALLVLMAVTIVGVAGIQSSLVELKISSNERQMRESFYLTESAVMEGVQRLKQILLIDLNEQIVFWHHDKEDTANGAKNFRAPEQWIMDGEEDRNCLQSRIDADTFIAAVEWKVAPGSSLIVTETRLYQNRVYSLCKKYNSDNLIEIGYNLRY